MCGALNNSSNTRAGTAMTWCVWGKTNGLKCNIAQNIFSLYNRPVLNLYLSEYYLIYQNRFSEGEVAWSHSPKLQLRPTPMSYRPNSTTANCAYSTTLKWVFCPIFWSYLPILVIFNKLPLQNTHHESTPQSVNSFHKICGHEAKCCAQCQKQKGLDPKVL